MNDISETQNDYQLTLSGKTSKKANKLKEGIDKKLDKIAKLKGQLGRLRKQIETAKKLYGEHITQEENKLIKNVEKLILKLDERLKQKSFSNWQRELMVSKMLNEIEFLVEKDRVSPKIREIQKEMADKSVEEMDEEDMDFMNQMTRDYLEDMGIDIDEEDFDFRNFTDPKFQDQFQKDYAEQHAERKKSEKDAQKEQQVKTTDKDFQKLYRSLVKRAHPDLVGGEDEKLQREEWMKQLSHAWEGRDYYALLLLQKQIDADGTADITLTQSMIKPLTDTLNNELRQLEQEKYMIKHYHPDTAFYHEHFRGRSEKTILRKIMEHKEQLGRQNTDVKNEYRRLKTQKSTKEMLNEIRESIRFPQNFIDYWDDY